jgi:hypothetical protein
MRTLWVVLLSIGATAAAAGEPAAFCGGAERDAAGGGLRVWNEATPGRESWRPPPCTGWTSPGFKLLVGISGTFSYSGGADGLLARFGGISGLTHVPFWSPTENDWRPIVLDAAALTGPDPDQHRADFTPEELGRGGDFFFLQGGGRASDVTYRMHVIEARPDRIVISTENVTPVRLFIMTLFSPGELQSVYLLERTGPGSWSYRSLTRTGLHASFLTDGRDASVINRAVALARHFTGIDLVREPALAAKR